MSLYQQFFNEYLLCGSVFLCRRKDENNWSANTIIVPLYTVCSVRQILGPFFSSVPLSLFLLRKDGTIKILPKWKIFIGWIVRTSIHCYNMNHLVLLKLVNAGAQVLYTSSSSSIKEEKELFYDQERRILFWIFFLFWSSQIWGSCRKKAWYEQTVYVVKRVRSFLYFSNLSSSSFLGDINRSTCNKHLSVSGLFWLMFVYNLVRLYSVGVKIWFALLLQHMWYPFNNLSTSNRPSTGPMLLIRRM